jgi:alanine racemase
MPRTWLEVSLDQIARNYRIIRQAAGESVKLMPVVKADAYRHGAVAIAQVLEREGVEWLAVSNLEEGKALREAGIRARILVMAERVQTDARAWKEHRLTPAIHDLQEIALLEAGEPFHLKIDSGMGRLGTNASVSEIIAATRGTRLEGLMTHFASSADFSSPQTKQQMERFAQIQDALTAAGIHPEWLHLASTNPLHFGQRQAWGNLARPGYALYGFVSSAKGEAPAALLEPVQPALSWRSTVLLTKDLKAGDPVGYGAMYRAPHAMRIGILGVGYADGLPHRLSGKGRVLAGGRLAPILGAVSMDVTTIDLSETKLKAGDSVTLLGEENGIRIDARQMARQAGTIAYSILCGISTRVPRIYI